MTSRSLVQPHVSLPQGAGTEKITAKYADGILEVTVPIKERTAEKTVEIAVGKK